MLDDEVWRAAHEKRMARWRVQMERARQLALRIQAWGPEVYALPPADRPFGQRGKYPKPPYPKAEDGTHLCRWCNVSLGTKKQRWWCSKDCLHQFQIRADWNVIRRAIEKRDRVCQLCEGQRFNVTQPLPHFGGLDDGWLAYHDFRRQREAYDRGQFNWCPLSCSLSVSFAVDHIVAVKEGGTDDPRNLRLLCGRCHGEVTAGQHARWALERREARDGRKPDQVALF